MKNMYIYLSNKPFTIMVFKILMLSIIMLLVNLVVFAQNQGLQKLKSFDENSYKNRLKNHEKFMPYNFRQQPPSSIKIGKSAINNLKVSDDGMAPMPRMSINKDIKYSMQIKKFNLQYPYAKPERLE